MFGAKPLGPTVAGTWYPADRVQLQRQLDDMFREADTETVREPTPAGKPVALIAPHAGFVYSGLVAAKGFRRLRDTRYRRVILVGPSHYASFDGVTLPRARVYRTPLGDVPLDRAACEALGALDGFRVDNRPFTREHCLEAELPFLQRLCGEEIQLVPLLIGMLTSAHDAGTIAAGLRPLLEAETLVVVSSDFTHYGPQFDYVPFDDEVPRRIEELDRGAIERILALDATGFESYVSRTGATICGRNPIRLLLELLSTSAEPQLVAYDTSGRMTGEWDHSVSYASLAFYSETAWAN